MPAAKKTKKASVAGVSQQALARHIDVSQPRIAQFVRDGTFQRLKNGKLDLDDCRIRYIRWLRDDSRKSTAAQAQSRLRDVRTREVEMRIAREEGRIVEMESVEAVVSDVLGTFRSELASLPAACTRDLALRATIEKQVNGAIDRCRERFEKAELALRTGGEVVLDGEEGGT